MVEDSGARTIFVGQQSLSSFEAVLPFLPSGLTIVAAQLPPAWEAGSPHLSFLLASDLPEGTDFRSSGPASADQCIYLLYTSGSTGVPKGVKISHGNLDQFVQTLANRYSFGPEDRFSQACDLTFDFSALALFCGLTAGAAVYPLAVTDKLSPVRFVRRNGLTVWYSVPSVALQMRKLRQLRSGVMPSLRVSIFCGEPLLTAAASEWRLAAPNSLVENHYGPTEATVTCSWYTWDETAARRDHRNGVVPIGLPMPGVRFAVRGEDGDFVTPGVEGELCIAGSQVCLGYTDPKRTAQAFFLVDDPDSGAPVRWYRTGDRVVLDPAEGCYVYVGRMDYQVKVRGYRVELGEVESVLHAAYGLDAVVVLPHPIVDGAAEGLVAFLESYAGHPDPQVLRERCRALLPEYMWPTEYHFLEALPLTGNGKFDRQALARRLDL